MLHDVGVFCRSSHDTMSVWHDHCTTALVALMEHSARCVLNTLVWGICCCYQWWLASISAKTHWRDGTRTTWRAITLYHLWGSKKSTNIRRVSCYWWPSAFLNLLDILRISTDLSSPCSIGLPDVACFRCHDCQRHNVHEKWPSGLWSYKPTLQM